MPQPLTIRQARRKAQLSQQQVAKHCLLSQSILSLYESGKRTPSPSVEESIRASIAFLAKPHPKTKPKRLTSAKAR